MIDSLQFARALEWSDREAIVSWGRSGCPVPSCRAWLPASKIHVFLVTAVTVIEILPHCFHTYERQKTASCSWKKHIHFRMFWANYSRCKNVDWISPMALIDIIAHSQASVSGAPASAPQAEPKAEQSCKSSWWQPFVSSGCPLNDLVWNFLREDVT